MTEFFKKENRIYADLTAKGKKERIIYTALTIFLYVAGGFMFWEFLCDACNMIGSIICNTPQQSLVELTRMLPFCLFAVWFICMQEGLFRALHAPSLEKRARYIRGSAITSMAFGTVIALYVLIGLAVGKYAKMVEGSATPLYPLDAFLFGLFAIAGGVSAYFYGKKLPSLGSNLPYGNWGKGKPLSYIFGTVSYMMSLASLSACIFAFWVLDTAHGNIFFNIMLWLNYAMPIVMVCFYRFVYSELKEDYKKKARFRFGLLFLVANAIFFALYLVAVGVQNEAPNLNAFGILPIEFSASFHAFAVLYGLNNLLCPFIALIGTKFWKKN